MGLPRFRKLRQRRLLGREEPAQNRPELFIFAATVPLPASVDTQNRPLIDI